MNQFKTTLGLLAILLAGGCSQSDEPQKEIPVPYAPIEITRSQALIVDRSNDFAFSLTRSLYDEGGNVFVSPLGVTSTLAMLANGAKGETLDEILDVLGTKDLADLNEYMRLTRTAFPAADNRVGFKIAQAVWFNTGITTKQTYADILKDVFDSPVMSLEFGDGKSAEIVNNWISNVTAGKIPKLLDEIPGKNTLITNALCFKGEWQHHFDKSDNREADFHNYDGSVSKVMMMTGYNVNTVFYPFANWSAVAIPFGNGAFEMVAVLPDTGVSLDEVVAGMKPEDILAEVGNGAEPVALQLSMPKFFVDYKSNICDVLKGLGLRNCFENGADFSGISDKTPLFNYFLHSATISVDEEGAEASSASVVGGVTSPGAGSPYVIDRPFVFFIREKSTHCILFSGIVRKL